MPSSSSSSRSITSGVSSSHGCNRLRSIRRWNEAARQCGVKKCRCGLECEFYTSMTDDNPGRRFYRCPNYSREGCRMWEWFDSPLCLVASQLVPLLREEIREMSNKVKAEESKVEEYELAVSKLKEDVELFQGEAESCMEEIMKLRRERAALKSEVEEQKLKMSVYWRIICGFFFVVICLSMIIIVIVEV